MQIQSTKSTFRPQKCLWVLKIKLITKKILFRCNRHVTFSFIPVPLLGASLFVLNFVILWYSLKFPVLASCRKQMKPQKLCQQTAQKPFLLLKGTLKFKIITRYRYIFFNKKRKPYRCNQTEMLFLKSRASHSIVNFNNG